MLYGLSAPRRDIGIRESVPANRRFPQANSRTHRPAPPRFIGPGEIELFHIPRIEPGLGHRTHRFLGIILGIAHPGHAITTHLHDNPAHLVQ